MVLVVVCGAVDVDMLGQTISCHHHMGGSGPGYQCHIGWGHYCRCAGVVAVIVCMMVVVI